MLTKDLCGAGPYQVVVARLRMAALDPSVEVSSGGLAGSSFVASLVNLFPRGSRGWR